MCKEERAQAFKQSWAKFVNEKQYEHKWFVHIGKYIQVGLEGGRGCEEACVEWLDANQITHTKPIRDQDSIIIFYVTI